MSAGSTTTNYGLPIYGANDIPKWDDTNTPFGNIDTALKGVVDDLTASDNLKFKFTKSGSSYGYLDVNGNFIPFKSPTGNKSITIDTVGTTSGIDVSDYASVSVTTDGLSKPSGNKSITISSTGTTSNIDVADYATASVTTSGLSPTPSGTRYIYSNGSYDVTNYSSAYVSVSASLSRTTLWSNSNPGSSSSIQAFNAQDVSLSSSMNNYSYIEIVWKAAGSSSSTYQSTARSTIFKPSDMVATGSGGTNSNFLVIGGYRWNGKFVRPFYCNGSYSTIHFQDGMNATNGASDNKTIIPLYVYGLS